ncbi:MAG: hypothetical protein V7752_19630 [Halopseudomonas sp.]
MFFLNYFNKISIKSIWDDNSREFIFKEGFDDQAPVTKLPSVLPNKTTLVFTGFDNKRIKSYDHLKPDSLKAIIKEHFLPSLYKLKRNNKKFEICLNLKTQEDNGQKDFFSNSVKLTEDDLPSFTKINIEDPCLDAFSSIDMLYNIEEIGGKGSYLTAFNIDGRTISANLISPLAIPSGYTCTFLFESDIFHSNADSSRQKLILPDGLKESVLYKRLKTEMGSILAEKIPQIKEKNKKTKALFEKQFPHFLGYFEAETVGLINKDDALAIAQHKFFMAEKEILLCEELTDKSYEKSIELSSRVLTEYILYREKIIRRMKSITNGNSEAEIHNLIVPKHQEFSGKEHSDIYQNNAWLLDDKFMVFRTILSEKRMDRVIQAVTLDDEIVADAGRPDIAMIFSADPDNFEQVDVVVVEIKKKTNDEKENQYAINQLLDRAVNLVAHCKNIQRVWYYAVMDINDKMATRLQQQRWSPLFSKGNVFYQEFVTPHPDGRQIPTPTFVLSFDAIVADAENRNHTFLEILREGMKRYADDDD